MQCPADSQCNPIMNNTLTTTQKLNGNAKKLQDLTKNGFCDTKKHHMPKVPESPTSLLHGSTPARENLVSL